MVRAIELPMPRTLSASQVSMGCFTSQYGLISRATSFGKLVSPALRFSTLSARSAGVLGRSTSVGAMPSNTNAGAAGVRSPLNAGPAVDCAARGTTAKLSPISGIRIEVRIAAPFQENTKETSYTTRSPIWLSVASL